MSIFEIREINLVDELNFPGLYLGIIDPASKPPHLALLHNNRLYHTTYRKTICGADASYLFEALRKRRINSVWVRFKSTDLDVDSILQAEFSNSTPMADLETCLIPAHRALVKLFGFNYQAASLLPDLLNTLTIHNLVESYWGIIHGNFQFSSVTVGGYTHEDVANRINQLRKAHVERKHNIPAGS